MIRAGRFPSVRRFAGVLRLPGSGGYVRMTLWWGGPCGDNDLSIVQGKYSWKSAQTLFSKTIGRRVSDPPGKSILMVLKNIKKYEGSWKDFLDRVWTQSLHPPLFSGTSSVQDFS